MVDGEPNPLVIAEVRQEGVRPWKISYRKYCENVVAEVRGPLFIRHNRGQDELARAALRESLRQEAVSSCESDVAIAKWHYEKSIPMVVAGIDIGWAINPLWRNGKRVPALRPAFRGASIKTVQEFVPEELIERFLKEHTS